MKFEPEDWYRIIRNARKKNPFQLHIMNQEEIFSPKNLEKAITNRKKNVEGNTISCLSIQCSVSKEEIHTIKFITNTH